MFFLLTCEAEDAKFIETLIDTTKIVTIRLVKQSDYMLVVDDVNKYQWKARFNTEKALRNRVADLLTAMNDNPALADTIKIHTMEEKESCEFKDKLAELISKL